MIINYFIIVRREKVILILDLRYNKIKVYLINLSQNKRVCLVKAIPIRVQRMILRTSHRSYAQIVIFTNIIPLYMLTYIQYVTQLQRIFIMLQYTKRFTNIIIYKSHITQTYFLYKNINIKNNILRTKIALTYLYNLVISIKFNIIAIFDNNKN